MHNQPEIAPTRQAALLSGLRHFHGDPCKHGHGTARNLSNNACMTCNSLYGKAHKARNADAERARKKAYKLANADKVREGRKRHKARHGERLRAESKAKRDADPVLAAALLERAWVREVSAALALAAREQAKAKRLAAIPTDEERKARLAMKNRRARSRRRALLRGCEEHATPAEISALLLAQNGLCAYCGARAAHCDHKLPISGPIADDTIENMQWLCAPCNSHKHATPDSEYRRLKGIPPRTKWDAPITWNL